MAPFKAFLVHLRYYFANTTFCYEINALEIIPFISHGESVIQTLEVIKKSYRKCYACFRLFTHFTTWILNLHKKAVRVEFVSQSSTTFSIFVIPTNHKLYKYCSRNQIQAKVEVTRFLGNHPLYTRSKPLSKKAEIYFQVKLFFQQTNFQDKYKCVEEKILFFKVLRATTYFLPINVTVPTMILLIMNPFLDTVLSNH